MARSVFCVSAGHYHELPKLKLTPLSYFSVRTQVEGSNVHVRGKATNYVFACILIPTLVIACCKPLAHEKVQTNYDAIQCAISLTCAHTCTTNSKRSEVSTRALIELVWLPVLPYTHVQCRSLSPCKKASMPFLCAN